MVRVISVHHFSKQYIHTIEQPTATTIAPPDKLLLALSSHCIEVRDLSCDGDLLFSFPTVDEVRDIAHCINGNYVLTLETKRSRQCCETSYVRVYANWDSVATLQQSKMTSGGVSLGLSECGMVQPMRARIAGRVTPTTNQSELCSLEMIELPVKRRPDSVACCQVSGNVLVLACKHLLLYRFVVRTHDISRLRFLDFEELPLVLELSFWPTRVTLCENYIGCMNDSNLHLFTVWQTTRRDPDAAPAGSDRRQQPQQQHPQPHGDEPLDYGRAMAAEGGAPVVQLPSVARENSAIHKHCPFSCSDGDITVAIKSSSPIDNWALSYRADDLLQLRLAPLVIQGGGRRITEEFKCLLLQPLYATEDGADGDGEAEGVEDEGTGEHDEGSGRRATVRRSPLRSEHGHLLRGVACLLATQQEGYLYVFGDGARPAHQMDGCVAVYPFTAPVHRIVMEDYVLHALTDTGLESYTLRIGHQLARVLGGAAVACPRTSDPVCLVGLRPFLGVEQLLLSDHFLVLLASSSASPTHSAGSSGSGSGAPSCWTLYNLELPSAVALYDDFLQLADAHRFSSPQTYGHLLGEAHVALRITLTLLRWRTQLQHAVALAVPAVPDPEQRRQLRTVFRSSCLLLAEHYALCADRADYVLALPYFRMGRASPAEVVRRVQRAQAQSDCGRMAGLLHYLRSELLQLSSWAEADVLLAAPGEHSFLDTVLELFGRHEPGSLAPLVLRNAVLRELATDKLIAALQRPEAPRRPDDLLALAALLLLQSRRDSARDALAAVPHRALHTALVAHWQLLFDGARPAAFSELAAVLMEAEPRLLGDVLAHLVTETRTLGLDAVLRVFLEFLPSHVGSEHRNSGLVLRLLLESYFQSYYSRPENLYRKTNYDSCTLEALTLLVRAYLSQLQVWQLGGAAAGERDSDSGDNADCYLFSKIRWPYLERMAPFGEDEAGRKRDTAGPAGLVLRKLQALLCSQLVPRQLTHEVLAFFRLNVGLEGGTSLQSIVLPVREAVPYLLDRCPQCLFQFGRDRFTRDDEWTLLIEAVHERAAADAAAGPTARPALLLHVRLFKDVLTHLATSVPLQRFLQMLPRAPEPRPAPVEDGDPLCSDMDNYEPYVLICKQTAHANHIKRLIVATGQKLLSTLNL